MAYIVGASLFLPATQRNGRTNSAVYTEAQISRGNESKRLGIQGERAPGELVRHSPWIGPCGRVGGIVVSAFPPA